MAIDTSEVIAGIVGLAGGTGAGAVIVKLISSKKETAETGKTSVETRILTEAEERTQAKFCSEQLENLEESYKELQKDFSSLRKEYKTLGEKFEDIERKYKQALTDLTYKKIELAAYKP